MTRGSLCSFSAMRVSSPANAAQRSKEKFSPTSAENAIEGMFRSAPSNAAEIVPE